MNLRKANCREVTNLPNQPKQPISARQMLCTNNVTMPCISIFEKEKQQLKFEWKKLEHKHHGKTVIPLFFREIK